MTTRIRARHGFMLKRALLIVATLTLGACSNASEVVDNAADERKADKQTKIYNYIEYSDRFASSGQPSTEQLQAQKAAGVERVIYIAFSDQEHSLANEDRIAKDLGLNYLQLPVDWKSPQKRDYYLFAQAMKLEPERKTLLHCQANFRASAFALLYRVLENRIPLQQAKADMNSIWVPNSIWTQFILDILRENNVETACGSCDWTPSTIGD